MLLGSRDATCGAVLLYETGRPERCFGLALRRPRPPRAGIMAARSANARPMLPLDGPAEDPATRWLLIVGLLMSRDPATRRRNLTFGIVGRFDGRTFTARIPTGKSTSVPTPTASRPSSTGTVPVGIAWLANWTDIVKTVDWPTAMDTAAPTAAPRRRAADATDRGGHDAAAIACRRSSPRVRRNGGSR